MSWLSWQPRPINPLDTEDGWFTTLYQFRSVKSLVPVSKPNTWIFFLKIIPMTLKTNPNQYIGQLFSSFRSFIHIVHPFIHSFIVHMYMFILFNIFNCICFFSSNSVMFLFNLSARGDKDDLARSYHPSGLWEQILNSVYLSVCLMIIFKSHSNTYWRGNAWLVKPCFCIYSSFEWRCIYTANTHDVYCICTRMHRPIIIWCVYYTAKFRDQINNFPIVAYLGYCLLEDVFQAWMKPLTSTIQHLAFYLYRNIHRDDEPAEVQIPPDSTRHTLRDLEPDGTYEIYVIPYTRWGIHDRVCHSINMPLLICNLIFSCHKVWRCCSTCDYWRHITWFSNDYYDRVNYHNRSTVKRWLLRKTYW